jgi:hypothetical protein
VLKIAPVVWVWGVEGEVFGEDQGKKNIAGILLQRFCATKKEPK